MFCDDDAKRFDFEAIGASKNSFGWKMTTFQQLELPQFTQEANVLFESKSKQYTCCNHKFKRAQRFLGDYNQICVGTVFSLMWLEGNNPPAFTPSVALYLDSLPAQGAEVAAVLMTRQCKLAQARRDCRNYLP